MKKDIIKTLLSRLNRAAFSEYLLELLRQDYGKDHVKHLKLLGEGMIRRELPDFHWPPDKKGQDGHYGIYEGAYVIHHIPQDLFKGEEWLKLDDPDLLVRLQNLHKYYARSKKGYLVSSPCGGFWNPCLQAIYFITNITGRAKDFYINDLLPKYEHLARESGILVNHYDIGCPESFKSIPAEKALDRFILSHSDGLSICLEPDRLTASYLSAEKELVSGVSRVSKFPYQPVYIPIQRQNEIFQEFTELLRKRPSESKLEKFLTAHYRVIFGPKYDRIETQLWLRFPQFDIAHKKRRLDIFLRNSVSNDWELFELKRIVPLTSTYRDVPILAQEISSAIGQLKNYRRILCQDAVKRKFAKEGMVYYEPVLHMVVGRSPEIPTEQWRWLVTRCASDVKLLTYDDLINEMTARLKDRDIAEQL
jgi:hypothetical protein